MKIILPTINKVKLDRITCTLLLMFIAGFLEGSMGVSSVVYFVVDIPIVIMFLQSMRELNHSIRVNRIGVLALIVVTMFLSQLIYCIVKGNNLANTFLGCYRTFRFFVFFFMCIIYLTYNNIQRVIKILSFLFFINIGVILFQFVFLGLNQDRLNGIFGTRMGANAYLNLFMVIVTSWVLVRYFYRIMDGKKVFFVCGVMLLIAALAEIKFYFVEFCVILFVCFLFKMKNPGNILKLLFLFIVAVVAYRYLVRIFPQFAELTSQILRGGFTRLKNLQSHYSTAYDIGRGVFMSRINQDFFTTEVHRILGFGIGACSSSGFVDNSFYRSYAWMHYDQFQTAYVYIEQGLLGFALHIAFFCYPILMGIKEKRLRKNNYYRALMVVLGIMGILLFYYNMSLYSQYGFLYYWALASAIVLNTKADSELLKESESV